MSKELKYKYSKNVLADILAQFNGAGMEFGSFMNFDDKAYEEAVDVTRQQIRALVTNILDQALQDNDDNAEQALSDFRMEIEDL